jgi:hypothetical protein
MFLAISAFEDCRLSQIASAKAVKKSVVKCKLEECKKRTFQFTNARIYHR